jgi:hypothetical protein
MHTFVVIIRKLCFMCTPNRHHQFRYCIVVTYCLSTVRVRVTLQLTVSKSWCRTQSGTFGQRSFFFFESYCPVIWGRPLWGEVGTVIYQSLSIQSRVVSQFLHKLFTVCVKHRSYLQYVWYCSNVLLVTMDISTIRSFLSGHTAQHTPLHASSNFTPFAECICTACK